MENDGQGGRGRFEHTLAPKPAKGGKIRPASF